MRHLIVPLLAFTLACSAVTLPGISTPTGPSTPRASTAANPLSDQALPAYAGLGVAALDAYRATFVLRFAGSYEWSYQLETRVDGAALEHRLHLEGLSAARNPGDVRLVNENGVNRMRGPGTDDECVQFPDDLDLGPVFLTPDHLVHPDGLGAALVALHPETIAGVETTHYTLHEENVAAWTDLRVDLWLHEATGAVMRYDLFATGPDPLFDAGQGLLVGRFVVHDLGPQAIEPIAGCEVELPLPDDATRLVRLPGLFAFDSRATAAETAAFYQAELAAGGWELLADPAGDTGALLLSYLRGDQTLEINIETTRTGVHVELLVDGA